VDESLRAPNPAELQERKFPPGDDEERRQKSLGKISDAIRTQLKITESHVPFREAGIKLDETMLEEIPGKLLEYKVRDGATEEVLAQATQAAEKYLDPTGPDRSAFHAFEIAGKFVLNRSLLQRAGDAWVDESLKRRPEGSNDREAYLSMIIHRVLDFDYLPKQDVLDESAISYLRQIHRIHPNSVTRYYNELQEKLKKLGIKIEDIVEQDEELMEVLTSDQN